MKRKKSEEKERDRDTEGKTSCLDALIWEEEQKRKRKRKGIETQRVDLPNPSIAIDEPIGDEEQNGK